MFSSWRTLPGKSKACSRSSAASVMRLASTPSSRALLPQEVARQHGDVLAPLAQRRQAQADDVEAVEQVLAEHALAHPLFQVLVRGGDHAHVGS
jgi:hypothetical protein